jgi:hypothetical protein
MLELASVSLIFQRDDLSIGDVGAEVNTAIEEIAKLSTACSAANLNWRAKCTTS